MKILGTNKDAFKDKNDLCRELQLKKSLLIEHYLGTPEQNNLIENTRIIAFKDEGNDFLVLDIDDYEIFKTHCDFANELFNASHFIVNKGKDSKGFDKWHLYFKYAKEFTQCIGIKGIDIFCGSERLLLSHPSLNRVKLKNYTKGNFGASIIKGSSPLDAQEMPKPLKSKLLKFLDRKEASNKLFAETKIQSVTTRNAQYKTCNIELYRQLVAKIKKAKNDDGSYDYDKLDRNITLGEAINRIMFEDKFFFYAFDFRRVHEIEDGAHKRNDFVCNHLLTKLLFDPSIPKDYFLDTKTQKLNPNSEFLDIIFTIAQSPFVHFSADREGEIIAALKSRVKNNKAFDIFYDENWSDTRKTIDEDSENELAKFYLEVLEKYKEKMRGFVPLKTISSSGRYDFWLYATFKKPNMIGKKYGEDKNPKLVTLPVLNDLFHTKFDAFSIPLVEFTFNMDRPERFFYETPSDKQNLLEDTELDDTFNKTNKVLKLNTFTETKYMKLFRDYDREELIKKKLSALKS